MTNQTLRKAVEGVLLPENIQSPAQYIGGELNSVVKDPADVRGRVCLAFPDTYTIGMSHHGLQVLYHLMNARDGWQCERAFTPQTDFEAALRKNDLPLYGLETFTPLAEFDIVGFSLQYDLCYTNVLTMLDLGRIPLRATERSLEDPLVIAGGPCAHTPEPMADFIDAFVIGDGEESLPELCDAWLEVRAESSTRREALAKLARKLSFVYLPSMYSVVDEGQGRGAVAPTEEGVPAIIEPAVLEDFENSPLPTAQIVPWIDTVQDRISIEIMRGCPGRCRFCQSTTIKRPIRYRSVETIVNAALEAYQKTGYNEISLLSLSTSDYRDFEELMRRLQKTFRPLGVAISVPSLRVNEQLQSVTELLNTDRRSGLTLAPEAALDDMRAKIGKQVTNEDLFEGCRMAFENGFDRVKLYFMCGFPGERPEDLDGIIDMAEEIARIGKRVRGRFPTVTANVSNFVPKPHTPLQWVGMARREYFEEAHRRLRRRVRIRAVKLKYHDLETSLLEGLMCRGDRSLGRVIEAAWRAGARFDAWSDQFRPDLWREAIEGQGIDIEGIVHTTYPTDTPMPWSAIQIPQGQRYLLREHEGYESIVLQLSTETPVDEDRSS